MADDTSLKKLAHLTRITPPPLVGSEDIVTELCAALFAGFRRYDQRVRARQYMDGLLRAEGRKSIANIAAAVGVPGDEQRLHHFVSSSPWAVNPVRKALAAFLEEDDLPSAWVALPVSIPKAGEHTVGVSRHFSPDSGQLVNGQRAYSMWYASERVVAPVSWRLNLHNAWLRDNRRRTEAEDPDELSAATPEDCVTGLLDDVRRWGNSTRLVMMDARGADEQRHLAGLFERESPVAVRISGQTLLALGDQGRGAGHGEHLAPARTVLDPARRLRSVLRRKERHEPAGELPLATATAGVRLPASGEAERSARGRLGHLTLLGVWHDLRRPPAELWLTNIDQPSAVSLLRMTQLIHTVSSGWRTRGETIGLRDYEGRSFQGWHRHMTLGSCAYAMLALRSAGPANGSGLSA
ncbi:IS701 family transposase [Streptomyces sp. NBC_01794]|uniref:IS701 family transposase n=1 Tax=Streptomyces sp. NBC_01794 TaxID=2975942 RepID=UPI003091641D|nr:transposase [Streptomyces sp. NBC_01794]